MNLQSLITILTFLVALLSSPAKYGMTPSQANSFAGGVVAVATQALNQQVAPQDLGTSASPVVPDNTALPTPSIPDAPQPSCTLTGTLSNVSTQNGVGGQISFNWTLTGTDPMAVGQLYAWKPGAPGNSYSQPWYSLGDAGKLKESTRNTLMGGLGGSYAYMAKFGETAPCYAFFPTATQASGDPHFFNGATSSPTPLEQYQRDAIE